MSTANSAQAQCYTCNSCGLPLPIRLPLPGEVAASWECRYCGSRFFATLIDSYPPEILANVRPAEDLNPRIAIGDKVLAELHRRSGRLGRGLDERHFIRVQSDFAITILQNDDERSAEILDLSAGGVGFCSNVASSIGQLIEVRFDSIPGKPRTRCIVRNCIRTPDGRFRVGAEFRPEKT